MSTIRVVNLQHTDATEPNIVLESDGTAVFASGITISGGTNLTISGVAEFASGTVSAPTITFIDDNNTGIYEPAADTVAITTSGTERLRVDNSGNVGIATSAPSLALHVAGPQGYASGPTSLSEVVTKSAARIQGSSNATTSLFFGAETSNANPYIQVANGNGSSSDPLVLQPFGGDVGIGTSSPGSYDSSASNLVVGSASGDEGITIAAGTSSSSTINFADGTSGSAAYTGRILYQHSADALTLHTNGGFERMRIDSSGNVGIGLSTSLAGLCVNNTIRSQNTSGNISYIGFTGYTGNTTVGTMYSYMGGDGRNTGYLNFSTNDTERMRIDSSGNVGIGISSPSAGDGKLSVLATGTGAGTSNTRLFLTGYEATSGNAAGLWFGARTDQNTGVIGSRTASGSIAFETYSGGWGERMRIDSSGRMLINHTADTAPASYSSKLQLCDTSYEGSSLLLRRDQNNSSAPALLFAKTRSASKGGNTVVQNGDLCGQIIWFAGDGTDANSQVAYMQAAVDGTPGSNDTPGRLTFFTTADGASAATERLRIDSSGRVAIGTTAAESDLHVKKASAGSSSIRIQRNGSASSNGDEYGALIFEGQSYSGGKISSHRDHGTWDDRGDLRFSTGYGNSVFTERMRITQGGGMSIGSTSSPNCLTQTSALRLNQNTVGSHTLTNISTTVTNISASSGIGGLAFVQLYNTANGAQYVGIVMWRHGVVSVVSESNATGLAINFSVSGSTLRLATGSGTVSGSVITLQG